MFKQIIYFSVNQKFTIFFMVLLIVAGGIYSMYQIPIDAVPDITNNQVQVVTVSRSLAPQEVEQLITFPVEVAVANIPDVIEIRSISRYGLSVVTVVFKDKVPVLDARQYVKEQLSLAEAAIPNELGRPELMPITTGLGEIYQYVLTVQPEVEQEYDAMQLRTIQDWIVKRQLSGIPGIVEISSFGGYLKQYEVAIDPGLMRSFNLSIGEVFSALEDNNQNSGGSYIEKSTNAYYIRTEGRVQTTDDIASIAIKQAGRAPILVKDIAKVKWGSPKRYGAMTMDGKGEVVGGITLMLKGANSSVAIENVKQRILQVQESLPKGVQIEPYLDRSDLVERTIKTVRNNLLEGGAIVILVLILLLGHWRAGLIVASVIPLSMLFAFILMNLFGVSANLMSLGAIDFGIVVDGAVIIVENIIFVLYSGYAGKTLSRSEMGEVVKSASSRIYQSAAFGVLIILVVFLPIITLTGIEGKMFKPMALTVSFALLGAMILAMTYVPAIASVFLSRKVHSTPSISDRIMDFFKNLYRPVLTKALRYPAYVLGTAGGLTIVSLVVLSRLGAEFIPTLEEGDLAMQMTIQPGSSLQESIKTTSRAEKILVENFPEVLHVVSKIGTAEVPTDPMAIEDADIMIILKRKPEWVSATTRDDLVNLMKERLSIIIGASFEFTQPIQLRFNELMTGSKADIAIKIFGEDTERLAELGSTAAAKIEHIPGAGDVKVEQTVGFPQLVVRVDRRKLAQYHLNVSEVNQTIRAAYGGETAGVVFEGEKKFDLVVRLQESARQDLDISHLFIPSEEGQMIPIGEVANVELVEGPMQISREDTKRRIVIGVNVRNRDVASLVADIQNTLNAELELPPGYYISYGGQFENLEAAKQRLLVAVPIALFLIFIFLFSAFKSAKYAILIFSAVPLSAIGGIAALWIRGMPFSISAGVGFIALFGVAVLNGIVLISHFNLKKSNSAMDIKQHIIEGGMDRLRPVLMTASVAAFGFFPMAFSSTAGAEVQKPLATVVIGGLVSSTALTLVVLPILYYLVNRSKLPTKVVAVGLVLLLSLVSHSGSAQPIKLTLDQAIDKAIEFNPAVSNTQLKVEYQILAEKQVYDPGWFDLTLNRGNINSFSNDWFVEVEQSLGNPLLAVAQGKNASMINSMGGYQTKIAIRSVTLQTQLAWTNWYLSLKELDHFRQWLPVVDSLRGKMDLAKQLGEIGTSDYLFLENTLSIILQNIARTQIEYREHEAAVQMLCGLNGKFVPDPTSSTTLFPADSLPISPVFDDLFDTQESYAERVIKTNRLKLFPEFKVGYFNQQINETSGFDGWRAGIAVPLYPGPNTKEIKKSRLESQIIQNQNEYQRNRMEQRLIQLQDQRRALSATLSGYPDNAYFQQEMVNIRLSRELGELGLFEVMNLVRVHFENYSQYIRFQKLYHEIGFNIEYLQ